MVRIRVSAPADRRETHVKSASELRTTSYGVVRENFSRRNDTVPILVKCGRGVRSIECRRMFVDWLVGW